MPKTNAGTSHRLHILLAGLALPALLLSLAGCGIGTAVAPEGVSNLVLSGHVHGGQQPVTGSNIALFATASTGYGGTLTPIATTTSDGSGNFSISSSYTCPAGQQAYIVAAGGNPGAASGTDNSAIFLVAALGSCNTLGAFNVDINEVTTVAAAYALSGFVPAGGAGMTEAAVVTGNAMPGITTSSTNAQGLSDAFLNASNIVSTTTGLAYTAAPTQPSSSVVPQAILHALGDILQPCVNSSTPTGSSSSCPALFAAATPPTGSGISAPVNAFQAALDIAQYPGNNVGTLFSLMSGTPAFPTSLSAAPNDWTVGIVYNNSQVSSALALNVDAYDNVYVASSLNAELLQFSPQGAVLSPTSTSTVTGTSVPQSGWMQSNYVTSSKGDNFRSIAIDPTGNLWLSDGVQSAGSTGVYEYSPGGTGVSPTQGTVTNRTYTPVNTDYNNYAIAADKYGDVWTASYKKSTCTSGVSGNTTACALVEFVPSTYTAYDTFGTGAYTAQQPDANGSRGLAVDSNTGNIWMTDIGSANASLFKTTLVSGGAATATGSATAISLGSTADSTYGVAVDKSGNAWIVGSTTGGLYEVSSAGAVIGTEILSSGMNSSTAPAYNVIDGNNNVFIANPGTSTLATSAVMEYNTTLNSYVSPNWGFSPSATYNTTTTAYSGAILYRPSYIAVDKSGALWALGSGSYSATNYNGGIVQILGVAAPTDPVLANGKFGVKP